MELARVGYLTCLFQCKGLYNLANRNAAINILFPVKSLITIDNNLIKKIMLEWLPILPIQKHSAQNAKKVGFAWRSDVGLTQYSFTFLNGMTFKCNHKTAFHTPLYNFCFLYLCGLVFTVYRPK